MVTVDEAEGFRLLVDHLVARGHNRIGFMGGKSLLHRRRQEHFRTLAGKYSREEWIVTSDASPTEAGREAARTIMGQPGSEKPTAIISASDIRALGGCRGLLDEGYAVPGDVALTGFDDIPLAEYANPSLTTIKQPIGEICEEAFAAVTGIPLARHSFKPPKLVVRGSTS
jgi:LacI family transcriptional regulator